MFGEEDNHKHKPVEYFIFSENSYNAILCYNEEREKKQ